MLPGEDVDPFFQCPVEIVVQCAVGLVVQNIVISETLACGKLVVELSGVFQGVDIDKDDIRLVDGLKQILESSVQLRIQIPEDDKFFLSAPGKLSCGINHAHPIA